jgi:hypothetical protein
MLTSSARKKILVLSDSEGLSRAIALNLRGYLDVEIVQLDWCLDELGEAPRVDGCSMIIVAASSPSSEPVVGLARAALVEQIGRVPLLIISDRSFDADATCQIEHLGFPFGIDQLHDKVGEILGQRLRQA